MELNADFSQRVVVHAHTLPWVASPMPGVDRRMLDRLGAEVARATSIVRYAPGSQFSAHTHDGGEEFLVLDGVFQDEHGDFPTGSYVRNPPTSAHTPGSEAGCTIFVKLWQFDPDDREQVRIESADIAWSATPRPGVQTLPLFSDAAETVRLERWAPSTRVDLALPGGGECLVLHGEFSDGEDRLAAWSWLRIPPGGSLAARCGEAGCTVWLKTGHLRGPIAAPATTTSVGSS